MQLGYTVWTWMNEEFGRGENLTEFAKAHFEEAVRCISHLRYDVLENFNFTIFLYEKNPAELKELLDRYHLPLVNLYHSYSWVQSNDDYYYELGERTCKMLSYLGAKTLNIQPGMWRDRPFEREMDRDVLDQYVKRFTKMGKIARDYGVQACMHPHGQTHIFHEDEIDYMIDHLDTDLVKLALDTGHTTLAGMDAVKAFDKYGDLIAYVHLKDANPNVDFDPDWPLHRLHALGQGTVDFQGVLRSLKKHNYDGVLCVEADYPLICNYETAQYCRNYCQDVLHI